MTAEFKSNLIVQRSASVKLHKPTHKLAGDTTDPNSSELKTKIGLLMNQNDTLVVSNTAW